GFIGNVALKSMEGVAKLINTITREEFKRNWYSQLAGLIALPVFKQLKKRIDPDRHNGASFIGLQGIVIKSHGGGNVKAFAQAIREAIVEVEQNIPQKIGQEVGMLLEDHES